MTRDAALWWRRRRGLRDVRVFAHLDAFGVDEEETDLVRGLPHEDGADDAVHENGFARARHAADKHMDEFAKARLDEVAFDVDAKRDLERGFLEGDDRLVEGNRAADLVLDLEGAVARAGDAFHKTAVDAFQGHIEVDLGVADRRDGNAGIGTDLVGRDGRVECLVSAHKITDF